jgi:hypothetical protein
MPSTSAQPPVLLHAAGLGVMIYSPAAARSLAEGRDHMPPGKALREPLRSLVEREQRVVLLGVGSPQVYYAVVPRRGRPPAAALRSAKARVTFGLHVEGGLVAIRDGYDPMQSSARLPRRQTCRMSDGYYAVHTLRVEPHSDAKADLRIAMYFAPSKRVVQGDGWPVLKYVVAT